VPAGGPSAPHAAGVCAPGELTWQGNVAACRGYRHRLARWVCGDRAAQAGRAGGHARARPRVRRTAGRALGASASVRPRMRGLLCLHAAAARASGARARRAGAMLRMGRAADAVHLLLRWAAAADAAGLRSSQAKAYLGAVVVWLHAGDAAQADAVFQARARAGRSWRRRRARALRRGVRGSQRARAATAERSGCCVPVPASMTLSYTARLGSSGNSDAVCAVRGPRTMDVRMHAGAPITSTWQQGVVGGAVHAGASSQAAGSRVGLEALCARQDAMDVAEFARSEQAGAGGGLLDAYRSGDAGAVRRCAAGPLYCDLDNQVLAS